MQTSDSFQSALAAAAVAASICCAPSLHAANTLAAEVGAATAAAQELETARGMASTRGLQIYVGNTDSEALLRRIRIQIDDDDAYVYELSGSESAALQTDALQALPVMPLSTGHHRLRARFIARSIDARRTTPRVHAELDLEFDKPDTAQFVTLELSRSGMLKDASLVADFGDAPGPALSERASSFARRAKDAPVDQTPASPALAQYNQAVAALRSGERETGEALLDTLGQSDARGDEALALRDLANLTLGYARMRTHRGRAAIDVFKRVRSPGPYGNPALLGLGWAYLIPTTPVEGTADRRDAWWPRTESASPALRRQMPFRYSAAVAADHRAGDLENALAVWSELIGRDPLDPATQEGMIAIAYALAHLGAPEQALERYGHAINRLQAVLDELDAARAQVDDGRLMAMIDAGTTDGWRRWLADLPYEDGTAYVRWLCADPAFLKAYESYRALGMLSAELAQHRQRLASLQPGDDQASALAARLAQLSARVDDAHQQQAGRLCNTASGILSAHRRTTGAYLAEARFAVARLHDPAQPTLARASGGPQP